MGDQLNKMMEVIDPDNASFTARPGRHLGDLGVFMAIMSAIRPDIAPPKDADEFWLERRIFQQKSPRRAASRRQQG